MQYALLEGRAVTIPIHVDIVCDVFLSVFPHIVSFDLLSHPVKYKLFLYPSYKSRSLSTMEVKKGK